MLRRAAILVAAAAATAGCSGHDPDPPDSCYCLDVMRPDATDVRRDIVPFDRSVVDTGGDADDAMPAMDGSSDARDASDAHDGDAFPDVNFDVATDVRDAAADVRTDVTQDTRTDTGTTTARCISGATGNYVVRFSWQGSQGSTANVRYDANNLPDTSRWHVSAASRSGFGYTPIYDDTFLGPGGLDLSSPAFIDVQISTVGLTAIRGATIAVNGRSFNTTASGSFSWMSFTGQGDAPVNLIANSTPYRWYGADATNSFTFVPGDNGVLLRIEPGPSSNSLIVNQVEICLDAS